MVGLVTRRVAVYLWTHCNRARERFLPAYSTGDTGDTDTTVYLFIDATSHSVPCPHRFVYICVMTQQNVDGSDRRNLFFRALIAPKPYVPRQNLPTKGTSKGCRLVLKIIYIALNCAA